MDEVCTQQKLEDCCSKSQQETFPASFTNFNHLLYFRVNIFSKIRPSPLSADANIQLSPAFR